MRSDLYTSMRLLVCLILIGMYLSLSAQSDRLRHISSREGLSQGMIYDGMQDTEGFIWFCTKDGLNRFDGYKMRVFLNDSQDSFSISNNEVYSIFEDSRSWLWLGTPQNGLCVYDRVSERFFHLRGAAKNGISLQSEVIRSIAEDPDGNIWIGTDKGLDKLIPDKALNLSVFEYASLSSVVSVSQVQQLGGPVYSIYFDKSSVYWGNVGQMFFCDIYQSCESKDIQKLTLKKQGNNNLEILQILKDKYGFLWLVHPHTLTRIHEGQTRFYEFGININQPACGFYKDNQGDFYLGHTGVSRFAVSPQGDLRSKEICQLKDSYCITLFKDNSDIVWIGTNGFGVYKFNALADNFLHFMKGWSTQHMIADATGRAYVWSKHRIHILDLQNGKPAAVPGLSESLLLARNIHIDRNGRYWFHFPFENGVVRLHSWDPQTGKQAQFPYTQTPNSLSFIFEDSEGAIWITVIGGNLLRLHPDKGQYDVIRLDEIEGWKGQRMISNCMVQTGKGEYWLGSGSGLLRFKWEDGMLRQTQFYQNNPSDKNSLSNSNILALHKDNTDPDILWIGTKGGGLNRLNTETKQFSSVSRKDGLPNDVIYGILQKNNILWLSTNKGIASFDPGTGKIQNFEMEEGLQDNEFNTFSFNQSAGGELMFGGINGLTVFYPEKVQSNQIRPVTVITAIRVANEDFSKKTADVSGKIPEFTFDRNMISFSFAALDYSAPEKNEYKYRLKGVDPEFVFSGSANEVNYANLEPGTYTFEVFGSNNSGVWSEKPALWRFKILPPWWRTWWAYIVYVSLLGCLIWVWYRFQIRKIRMEKQLEFEKNEAERLAELDKLKSNFFANVTHEFRTPLTLILEPVRQILAEDPENSNAQRLKLVENNSIQLLQLVNQLLDLSKIESGYMELDAGPGSLEEVVGECFEAFRSLAEKKGIEMKINVDQTSETLVFDRQKLQLILNNLLSNAIKFTPEGGKVSLHQKVENTNQDTCLATFQVQNSGPVIPEELKDRIFERFYQVDSTHTRKNEGTGIGLSLTKELVTLLGGTIMIQSEETAGTIFTVEIPLSKSGSHIVKNLVVQDHNSQSQLHSYSDFSGQSITSDFGEIILVIEDNPELREFICSTLASKYQVLEAENGMMGIEKAIEHVPDLVISDVMMPEKDGYEVCDTLKNNILTSHIPVILLTAKSAMESKIKGLKTGADDYLTKPFHTEELLLRINNQIAARKLLRQKYAQEWMSDDKSPQTSASELSEGDKNFIMRLQQIVENALDNDELTTDEIAREMYVSRVQLHRKLKAIAGQSTSEFVRNYRLDKAREYLSSGAGNVNEIAARVGISNRNYFTKSFRERFGILPSEI